MHTNRAVGGLGAPRIPDPRDRETQARSGSPHHHLVVKRQIKHPSRESQRLEMWQTDVLESRMCSEMKSLLMQRKMALSPLAALGPGK